MPRFVLLRHDLSPKSGRPSHWDLMLEHGGSLATWCLETWPFAGQGSSFTVGRLPDHRLGYLQFQGSLSGDRGVVQRIEEGDYFPLEQSEESWVVRLSGRWLRGRLTLRRSGVSMGDNQGWTLTWESWLKDEAEATLGRGS